MTGGLPIESGAREVQTYAVTDAPSGGSLLERIRSGLRVRELAGLIADVARGLDPLHARGAVHGDIRPSNILLRADGQAVLVNAGRETRFDVNANPSADGRQALGTPGYMSPEQATGAALDGRADLYSLGMVVFEALTGILPFGGGDPGTVLQRQSHEPVPRLPAHLEALQPVMDRALARLPADRYPDLAAFAEAFGEVVGTSELGNLTLRSDPVDMLEIRAVGAAILAAARRPRGDIRQRVRLRDRPALRSGAVAAFLLLFVWWASALVERSETAARVLSIVGLVRDPAVQEAWDSARALHRDPNQSLASVVAGYRRVLSLDRGDRRAKVSLDDLAQEWTRSIERALAQGNVTLAASRMTEYLLVFPSDPQLAELAQRISDRRTADNLVNTALAQLRTHGIGDPGAATLAIRAYQEVLRLVPEHPVAQTELDVLADHYARLAANAVATGDMGAAIGYLDQASSANDKLPMLDAIRAQLRSAAATDATLGAILLEAARLRAAGSLIDPPGANAAELYHRVLATAPDNASAIAGIDEVVEQLISSIDEYLTAGDLVSAGQLVARAGEIGLEQAAVAGTRARLTRELERFRMVARNLEDAAALFEQGLITEPPGRNVVLLLREVQRVDPRNQAAQVMLQRSAERLAEVAEEAYQSGMKNQGRSYLDLALSLTPDVEAWRILQNEWRSRD